LRAESRGLAVIQTQADELLPLKNKIDELRKRVKEVKKSISDILSNDEDMNLMYLMSPKEGKQQLEFDASNPFLPASQKPDDTVDTMSLEMLFENYLNEIEWIASEVEEVIDEITNTEENVVLQLDILRNRILRFELSLSMSSFVVTCGALVTGLFGMNLTSQLETEKHVFYIVTVAMITGMAAMWLKFVRYGHETFGKAL
jgi:magnesium transporter